MKHMVPNFISIILSFVLRLTVCAVTVCFPLSTFAQTFSFTHSGPVFWDVCENSTAIPFNDSAMVSDGASGETVTWSVHTAATNGTLSADFSIVSPGGIITPSGLTYKPNNFYVGLDSFTIEATNGSVTITQLYLIHVNTTSAGNIIGPLTVHAGGAIILRDTVDTWLYNGDPTSGGNESWVASNGNATIADSTIYYSVAGTFTYGSIRGITEGLDTITCTLTNMCGTYTTTMQVTVTNPAQYFTGGTTQSLTVCENSGSTPINSLLTVFDISTGMTDTWSITSGPANGVVLASYATTTTGGMLIPSGLTYTPDTGFAGTDSFTVQVVNGTTIAYTTINVTITAPSAGTITGENVLCVTSTIALTDSVTGGSWSSGTPSIASVNSAGLVSGVALGTAIISYTVLGSCGSSTATETVTVSLGVNAGTITGTATVCNGSTTNLTDAVNGGIWSSGNTSVATVGTSGVVTGMSVGTATIYYTVVNGCGTATARLTVRVSPTTSAGTITGTAAVCLGSATTLSDAVAGGSWSSVSPGIASVGTSGVVTGVSAGNAVISYSITNSCGTTTAATRVVTVNTAPSAGTISGAASVCGGATVTLSDAVTGGTWSSGAPAIATVSATGVVTGVASGAAAISYHVTNSCGTATVNTTVTVTGSSAGTITGLSTVGVGLTITLSDMVSGGSWSASNSHASVSGGIVTGLTNGTVIVSYSVSSACGTSIATKGIVVSTLSVSAISGYFFSVCTGSSTAFWDATSGGSWSMSPASVATVSPTGIVTGITAGTATLSYTIGGTSATATVSVNPTPTAINGSSSLCVGGTTSLSDTTAGGAWSSAIPSVAPVGSAGVVSGTIAGTTIVYYTVPVGGCRASLVVTVVTTPWGIVGPASVCEGLSIVLSDFVAGGTWSSTPPVSVAALGTASATITGTALGTSAVTYTIGACYKTYNVTVKPVSAPVSGTLTVCTGLKTFLSDLTTATVSWSSSNATVATVTASGAVTGVTPGTATITYTPTSACIATAVVTVNPSPGAVGAIMGATSVSHSGPPITLSDTTAGGIWSSSNTAILAVGSITGIVTAGASSGSAYIYYTVTNSFGCSSSASKSIGTGPAPPAHTGTATTTVGATINLVDEAIGGEWMSSDNTGVVTAMAEGSASIAHTVVDDYGEVSTTLTQVLVNPLPLEVSILPNPNTGAFTVHGTTGASKDEPVTLEITSMVGQVVYTNTTVAASGIINASVLLNGNLANGNYLLQVKSGSESKVLHFVITK